MTSLVGNESRDLSEMSTDELRADLSRGLTLTVEVLVQLSRVWAELERRGEDLSELRRGIARNLPLIASGRLAAESVVAFAHRPALLRAIDGIPLELQRRLVAGETVTVIDPLDPMTLEELPLARLPAASVRLIFADGDIRSPTEQRLAIRARKRRTEVPQVSGYRYRPRYDRDAGTISVGRMTVRLADLLAELSAAAGPDHPPADDPNEYVTAKVRLTAGEMGRLLAEANGWDFPSGS
jgi:hypothetical protein